MMEKSWPKTDCNESVVTKGSNNSNLFEFLDMTSCDEKEKIQLKNTLYSNNNKINSTFNSTPPPARFRGSYNNNANRNPKYSQQPSLPASNPQQSSPHNNSHQQTNYIHQPKYQKHDFHEPSSRIARTFPDTEYHHYNNTKNNNSNNINNNTKTNNTNNSNKRLDDNSYFNEKWHNNSKKAPYAGIRENTTTSSSQYSSQSSVNSKKDYKHNKDNVSNYQNKEPFNRDGQTISTMSPPLTSNSQQSASTTSSSTPSTPNSSQNNVIVHQQQQQQQQQQIPHYSAQPLQYGNPPLHQPPPQAVYQTSAPMSIIQQGLQGNMFVGHHGYLPGPPGTQQMIPASYLHNEMQQQRVDSGSGRDNQSQREDQRDSNSQVPMNTIVRGGGNSNRRGGRSRGGSGGTRREYQPRHQSQNQQPSSEYIQPMMDQQQAVMGAGGYAQYYIQPYPQYYAQAPNAGHIANIHSASQATAATAQSLTGQPLYIQAPMYGYPYPYPYGYPMFHPMMQTQPHLAHHQHSGEIVMDENQIAEGSSVVVNDQSIPQMWHPHPHMAYQQEHPPPHIYQQTPHQNDVEVEEYQQNQPEYILMANPNQINYQLMNQQQQQQQQQQSGEVMVDEMSLNDAQGFHQQSQMQQYDDNMQINNEQQMIEDGNIDDNSIIVEKTRDLMIQTDEVKSHHLQHQQQQHLVNVQTNTINSEYNNNINVSYDDSIEKDISIVTKTTPDTINVEFISNINVNKSNSNVSVNNEHHQQMNHQNVPNSSCSPVTGPPQPSSAIVVSVLPLATQISTSNVINDSSVNNSKANSIELGTSKLNNNTDSKLMIKNKEKPPAWGNVSTNTTTTAITTNAVAVTPTVMKKQTASVSVSAIPTDLQTKTHHHQQPQQPPPPFSNSNIIAGNVNETVPKNLVMTTIPANLLSPQQQNQPQTIYENSFSPQSYTKANTTTITTNNKTAVNTNTNSFSSIMTSQQQQQQILTAADKKTETHQAMTEKAKQEFVSTITAANTLSSDVSRRPEPSPQRIQNIQTQTANKDVKIENIRDTAQQTVSMSSAKSPTVTAAAPSSSVSWAGLLKGVPVGQSQRATPPQHVTSPSQMAGNNNNNNKPLSKLSLPVQVSTDNTPQKSMPGPTITLQMPSNTSPGVLSYSAASAQGLQSPQMATMPSPTPFPITANKKLPQKIQPAAIIKQTPADEYSLKLGDWLSKYKIETNSLSLMPRGLLNKSNYCYINAILQALVACPPFYHLMTSLPIQPPSCKADSKTPVTDAMVELVSNYNALPYRKWQPREKGKKEDVPDIQTDSAFEPSVILKLLNTIRSDMFPVEGRQEDAEEFLGFILNRMNDEMIELIKIVEKPKMMQPEKLVAVSTSIHVENGQEDDGANTDEDPIEWQVISGTRNKGTVTRTTDFGRSPISDIFGGKMRSRVHREGDHSTDNIQPFFTLPLDIEKAASVREALEILVGRDQLEGVTCSRTNQEIAAWQQVTLEELPVVLILHLKCFDFKKEGCTKILKTVEFPVELKMDPKIMSSKVKYNQKQKHYKLFAVVYHDGKEASKGHYVTDVFHIGYSNWIRYDDSTVKPISEHIVLHPRSPRVPYLLYYRRYDTIGNSHSNRERDHHFSSSSNTSTSSHYQTDHNRHGKATK